MGSRLMPVTAKIPKPLAPIAGKPCIFHALDLLKKHGVTEVIATVRHGSAQIRNACARLGTNPNAVFRAAIDKILEEDSKNEG